MLRVFQLVWVLWVALVSVAAAQTQTQVMSAPDAFAAAEAADIILIDIRSPEEWRETGVAQGALPVTMHAADFGANLARIMAGNPGRPLALICATGGRSNYVTTALAQNGITGVRDVSEGMFGNGRAPGWIARNLPIVDAAIALEAGRQELQ